MPSQAKTSSGQEASKALEAAIGLFLPDIAKLGRDAIARLKVAFPSANRLVYDNYNALAVAFASGETASSAAFSITFYPRWVSLFFSRGIELEDPAGVLKGSGARIRHLVLESTADLERPPVTDLLEQAIALAQPPFAASGAGQLLIKTQMDKKRARRPKQ